MRLKTQYVCSQCGFATGKWHGKCLECESWNSLIEEVVSKDKRQEKSKSTTSTPLSEIQGDEMIRQPLPMQEIHRVLGEGLTTGSVVLIGGDPGIGKSTLLLQLLGELAQQNPTQTYLYVSGEESAHQIKMRADRMNVTCPQIQICTETNLVPVLEQMKKIKPTIMVMDSIQTLYWPELSSIPGSVSQVREVADRIVRAAKTHNVSTFIIGHITKEGSLAGPKMLEHLVDTVLQLEGDRVLPHRILRSLKNRFGPTDEIGIFQMKSNGFVEVNNPSEFFLQNRSSQSPGSVVFPAMEGTRPLLLEIQALATDSSYGVPLRNTVGFDKNRLTMLLAILEKKGNLEISKQDVYVNVVGGMRISEPAADLAVLAAIVSSLTGRALSSNTVAFGEVGLSGEIRPAPFMDQRIKEAKKLGFEEMLGPQDGKIQNLSELIAKIQGEF